MKKKILLSFLLIVTNFLFSQNLPEKLKEKIEDSGLFAISYSNNLVGEKRDAFIGQILLEIECQSSDTFTRRMASNLIDGVFENPKTPTFKEIKDALKSCRNIFMFTDNNFSAFRWNDGKALSYSTMYSQSPLNMRISGAGIYVFRVFDGDKVYIMRLTDMTDLTDENEEYNALSDILYFKKGQKLDRKRGIEGNQGYYFLNNNISAKKFYEMLLAKDSSLPKSALKFQEAAEKLEEILNQY